MNRPLGVMLLAGLQFLLGGLGVFNSLAVILNKPLSDRLVQNITENLSQDPNVAEHFFITPDLIRGILLIGVVMGMLLGLLNIGLGYGLLKLKRWAWTGVLILQVLAFLVYLKNAVDSTVGQAAPDITAPLPVLLLTVLVPGVSIGYLLRPKVRQAFNR